MQGFRVEAVLGEVQNLFALGLCPNVDVAFIREAGI
jgi:hypothetical protein